jgi:hypothetical protein
MAGLFFFGKGESSFKKACGRGIDFSFQPDLNEFIAGPALTCKKTEQEKE